jgi:hypothetical protein
MLRAIFAAFLAIFGIKLKDPAPAQPPAAPVDPLAPLAPRAPVTVTPVGIDYSRYNTKPDGTPWTPYELQTAGGPLAGGKPPNWDWKEWARVNGRADPTAVQTPQGGFSPRRSGFNLTNDGAQYWNTLEPGLEYWFIGEPLVNGRCELAWAAKGNRGFIETWVSETPHGNPVPGSYAKTIMGPAGQTYFPAADGAKHTGGLVYHVLLSEGPVELAVMQVPL